MPRFSVVVPAYNAEATLAETIQSVLAQDMTDWQCIIVDDGSSDCTHEIALSHAERDGRFVVLTQDNAGTAGAYNTGVRAASSDLVVLLSSDDLLLPSHMGVMADLVDRNPACGIFSGNGEYLHSSGSRTVVYEDKIWLSERSLELDDLLTRCFFSVGAVFRRSVWDAVEGFRVGTYGEDYDFWLRAMAVGSRHRYTPERVAVHRLSVTQKSSDRVRVYQSNVESLRHLIDAGYVVSQNAALVEQAISERLETISRVQRESMSHVDRLFAVVSTVCGERCSRSLRSALGSFRRVITGRARR